MVLGFPESGGEIRSAGSTCATNVHRSRIRMHAQLIDGLGPRNVVAEVPVSRSRTPCHFISQAFVALKLLVSLLSRLVACSARIVVDRQTHRHTDQVQ